MNYKQVIAHFKGLTKAAQALDTKKQNINNWKDKRIPSKWQMRIEGRTNGLLEADAKARKDVFEVASFIARRAA